MAITGSPDESEETVPSNFDLDCRVMGLSRWFGRAWLMFQVEIDVPLAAVDVDPATQQETRPGLGDTRRPRENI